MFFVHYFQAHVSVRSYRRAHHLYDLAREQTDLVRRIKMTEEEEEEQRREGSAKKSARSYVHRTYELKETTGENSTTTTLQIPSLSLSLPLCHR